MLDAAPSSATAIRPLKIAVAEDVLELRQLVRLWLEAAGHEVACAGGGREILRLLQSRRFDLVVTDILMPEVDGLELLQGVRKSAPETRILAMSGGGQHLMATDCLNLAARLGAHAVLRKPFDRPQLLAAVAQALAP